MINYYECSINNGPIISNVENSCVAFLKMHLFFANHEDFLMSKNFFFLKTFIKRTAFILNLNLFITLYMFAVTFDQFNVSLLNKSITFFQFIFCFLISITLNFLMVMHHDVSTKI